MKIKYSDKKILYLHLPKCGGTSIEVALGYTDPLWKTPGGRHRYIHEYDKEVYDYIFTVTRNPYARLVSYYHYAHSGKCAVDLFAEQYNSFQEWVLDGCPAESFDHTLSGTHCNYHKHVDGDVDVYKIENLRRNWQTLLKRCGVPWYRRFHVRLKHKNQTTHKHYMQYYKNIEVRLKARWFLRHDLDYFGYDAL